MLIKLFNAELEIRRGTIYFHSPVLELYFGRHNPSKGSSFFSAFREKNSVTLQMGRRELIIEWARLVLVDAL